MDGLQRPRLRGRGRSADRHHRSERRREVDAAPDPGRPGAADRGRRGASQGPGDRVPGSEPRRRRADRRGHGPGRAARRGGARRAAPRGGAGAGPARRDRRPLADGTRARPAAGSARPVGGDRRTGTGRAGSESAALARHPRGRSRASHEPAVRRSAQARGAGGMPHHAARPAPAGRARDASGRGSPGPARGADRRVLRRRGLGLARPLPAGRHRRPDRRARRRQDHDLARQLLGVRGREGDRAPAPATALRLAAEGDRAPRGGDRALQALGEHRGQRTAYQAGAEQAAADRPDGQGRPPGVRAAQDRVGDARGATRREEDRRAPRRHRWRSTTIRSCSTST